MGKVILYIAASLDGFIADKDGNVEFLHDKDYLDKGEDYGYANFYENVGITIMGNKTYKQVLSFGITSPYPEKKNYVFSETKQGKEGSIEFINQNHVEFVKELKSKEKDNIWLVGGGIINQMFLDNDLIDDVILTLFPVFLGSGVPLFPDNQSIKKLKINSTKTFPKGIVQITGSL